jgi:hypothetical protein
MTQNNSLFEEINDDFRLDRVRAGASNCKCCGGVVSTTLASVKALCDEMQSGSISDPIG